MKTITKIHRVTMVPQYIDRDHCQLVPPEGEGWRLVSSEVLDWDATHGTDARGFREVQTITVTFMAIWEQE